MKRIISVGLLITIILIAAGCGGQSSHMVGYLTCEYKETPFGIDEGTPLLGWRIESDKRNVKQTAYRIIVASGPKALADDTGDIWDSGRIESDETVGIPYEGPAFESATRYYWKVCSWNGEGKSRWSRPSWWETGLLTESDWGAEWIGDGKSDPATDADFFDDDPAPLFRKAFTARDKVRRARLYISGLGYYEASINGGKVGTSRLDPGWTDYSKRVLYAVHDVTRRIKSGENVLGVTLGNGWYNPLPMRMWGRLNLREELTIGRPRLIARLVIEYADGSTESIVTDESWKTTEGPILRNNIYLGEMYDARREIPGWNKPGFDDTDWRPAAVAESPGGTLRAQAQPPIVKLMKIKPVEYWSPKHGVLVFDMGRNFAGTAQLWVKAPEGTKIEMTYGELLNEDGTVNVMTATAGQIKPGSPNQPEGTPIPAAQVDTYICKGAKNERWEPRFTYHGFRYVEVRSYDGESVIEGVTGFPLAADVKSVGTFECSNDLFNRIHGITRMTFLSNLFSVQSDCPHREKFGYGGDIVPTAQAFMYNFDMATFYQKVVRDFADAQRPNGGMTETAPYVGIADRGFGGGSGPIGWTLAHPHLLTSLGTTYGNMRIAEEQYGNLKRLVDFLHEANPDHIIDHGIGDHESLDPKDEALSGTSFYKSHVLMLAYLAGQLGKKDDTDKYFRLAYEIDRVLMEKFHNGDGVYGNGTQGSQAIAFKYGNTSPADASIRLISELDRHNGHLSTGIFGTHALLEVLSRFSPERAYAVVNKKTFPGWGWMLANGATTLWEHWELSENTYSHNHPMFGSVDEWFYTRIAGIRPGEGLAFKEFQIIPGLIGDLDWARASYEFVRGTIAVDWRVEGDSFHLDVNIPANTAAYITMPALEPSDITENGIPVEELEEYALAGKSANRVIFRVESGSYHFVSKLPPYYSKKARMARLNAIGEQ